jgi:amidase
MAAVASGDLAGDVAIDRAGAFCAHARVRIDGAAAGPLAGLTFAVKDLFAIEGVAACCGNPTWLATHAPAARTARAVRQLLDAGATLIGLTVTDELALSLTGENRHYGTPLNSRAPARVPGGSSSGSAAAVAAGLADLALGTDTGGSVRVPASHCGVLGFRPSHGAVSVDCVWPLAPRFDTVGWFARDAALLQRAGAVLLDGRLELTGDTTTPARLLFPKDVAALVDAPAGAAFGRAAAGLARRLGCPLQPVIVSAADTPLTSWLGTYLTLQNAEIAAIHRGWIDGASPCFGSLIGRRIARALNVAADEVERAEHRRARLGDRVSALLAGGAWLVWPSAAGAPPPRGLGDDATDEITGRALTLSALASLAGLPQISLPLAEADGCPFGVSLIASRGADRALLAAAIGVCAAPLDATRPEVSS